MKSIELMEEEIKAQSKLFTEYAPGLYEDAVRLLERTLTEPVKRVYITGCGDSYFAGTEMKDLFAYWAKVEAFAVHALEFSRYVCPKSVGPDTLVLSISASGKVTRTVEAATRAKEAGGVSIAITSNSGTPVAKAAGNALEVAIPNNISLAPGVRSYAASQVSLITLALALSKVNRTFSEAEIREILSILSNAGAAMEKTVLETSECIKKYVTGDFIPEFLPKHGIFHVLGSGPNLGTANFGTMKLLESSGYSSIPCDIEEWAHSHYFTQADSVHVLLLAPRGKSFFRAKEVQSAVHAIGAKLAVVCEKEDESLFPAADYVFPITGMKNIPEWLSPVLWSVPIELLSMHISAGLGRQGLDFENKPWLKEENFRQIYHSEFKGLKEEEL